MKQALLSAGAAFILAGAALVTPAAAAGPGHMSMGSMGHSMGPSGIGHSMGPSGIGRSMGPTNMGPSHFNSGTVGGPSTFSSHGPSTFSRTTSGNIGVTQNNGNWSGKGGNWNGMRHDNDHRGHHHFRGATFAFGFGAPYYDYGYYDDSYDDCYRLRRVWTPYGWRLHRVLVCDAPYVSYAPY